jgi:hypothetical protein
MRPKWPLVGVSISLKEGGTQFGDFIDVLAFRPQQARSTPLRAVAEMLERQRETAKFDDHAAKSLDCFGNGSLIPRRHNRKVDIGGGYEPNTGSFQAPHTLREFGCDFRRNPQAHENAPGSRLLQQVERSPLVSSNKGRFRQEMFGCLAFGSLAGGLSAGWQTIDRERKQTKTVSVNSVSAWWARAAVARLLEIIDRLLEALTLLCGTLHQGRPIGGNVVGRPVTPSAGRSVRIVTKEHKAAGRFRCVAPIEGRGEVRTITSETARDRCPVRKGTGSQLHGLSP